MAREHSEPTAETAATPRRWRRRKEARPAEILAAALDVFVERGFSAARLDEVAARAGVSKGTLYLYFDSKEALFKALVRETLLPNLAAAEAMVRDYDGSMAQLLARLLRTFGQLAAGSKVGAIPKLIVGEAGNFPDLANFYREEVIERGMRLVSSILMRGIAAGEFRPVDVRNYVFLTIAPILVTAIWRYTFERHGGPPLDAGRLMNDHVENLLRGLRPSSEGPTPAGGNGS